MFTNLEDFRKDLQAAGRELELNYRIMLRSAMMTLFAMIVARTPVRTGRLVGSWSISRDKVGTFMLEEGESGSAEDALARAYQVSFANAYAVWYIYNNVPYADEVEYGLYPEGPNVINGFSRKAPEGMLAVSVQEFESRFEALLNRVIPS